MKRTTKVLLAIATTALATLVVGGAPAVAHDFHPIHHDDPATLHRDCTWSVTKSASTTDLTLSVGQTSAPVTYTIVVSATCTDTHHDEHGDHHAHDPAVDGHTFHPELHPDHGTDLCVAVSDPNAPGPLFGDGIVCESDLDHGSISTTYQRTFGPFAACGEFTDTNTVTVSDLVHHHVLAHASVTIHIHVPCVTGCTLTQGYWKTHSREGPAPYDTAWQNLGALEEDTPFFSSGLTWYQVFWTSSAGGNAWIILAHQYMAAKLNILDGASSTTAVNAAIAYAESFFATYTTPSASLSKSVRATALANAATLDQYNNGLAAGGPPHCDE